MMAVTKACVMFALFFYRKAKFNQTPAQPHACTPRLSSLADSRARSDVKMPVWAMDGVGGYVYLFDWRGSWG